MYTHKFKKKCCQCIKLSTSQDSVTIVSITMAWIDGMIKLKFLINYISYWYTWDMFLITLCNPYLQTTRTRPPSHITITHINEIHMDRCLNIYLCIIEILFLESLNRCLIVLGQKYRYSIIYWNNEMYSELNIWNLNETYSNLNKGRHCFIVFHASGILVPA